MSRVEINAGGRHIIVDHDGELEPIRQAAISLWEASESAAPSPGPAVGFQAERRWSADMRAASNGAYGSPAGPVTA